MVAGRRGEHIARVVPAVVVARRQGQGHVPTQLQPTGALIVQAMPHNSRTVTPKVAQVQ